MTLTTGIERIRIRNYRVLRDVELDGLTPVTALLGPNGSGKSTLLDAIMFVHEALGGGLAAAWSRRDGLDQIRSRGAAGPVEIELGCRADGDLFTYRLIVDEADGLPVVVEERLVWQEAGRTAELEILKFSRRHGIVRRPDGAEEPAELADEGVLGVGTFGQLARNAQTAAFLRFVGRLQLIDLDVTRMRSGARGPRRGTGLEPDGANIATRVQHLQQEQPGDWADVLRSLRRYVPRLEDIATLRLGDGREIVRLKERGVDEPILPENISDGTLLLLGYLVALKSRLSVMLIEEPENQVHPRLHYLLADDARGSASEQVIVATHAPRFVDAMKPDEVRAFARNDEGHAEVKQASDEEPVVRMAGAGEALGDLWTEGYLRFGDPLAERP